MTDRFVSIGECMVEFSRLPGAETWRQGFAGDTLNVAWAVRALSGTTSQIDYVTRIGNDAMSARLLAFLDSTGIGTGFIQRDKARTLGLYTIDTDADGERSFSYWRSQSAARHLGQDEKALSGALVDAGMIYLSGITAAVLEGEGRTALLRALQTARGTRARIIYDPNYRPVLWESRDAMQDFTRHVLPICDFVLPTFDDERAAFGDEEPAATLSRIRALSPATVILKNGTEPTTIATPDGTNEMPPAKKVRAIDTTGAGDSFNGGFLAALLNGQPLEDCVRTAQAVSALVVTRPGALVPMDDLRAQAGD